MGERGEGGVREDVKEDMLISVRVLMLSEMSREPRSLFFFL